MSGWVVERVVHFGPDDFVVEGLAHFGFHVRAGGYYAIAHQRHTMALLGPAGDARWTAGAAPALPGVPNIAADLAYPMFVDALADGSLVVSNFGSAQLLRIDPDRRAASVLVDGRALGMADMGNAVVDANGCIWVNEVTGCRLWRFDPEGRVALVLGDGRKGFDRSVVSFDQARFGWIYDIRRGPDGRLYVLDSGNFAVRAVDLPAREVVTLIGTGEPGPAVDDVPAGLATFGSDPAARFDGPISLAVDDGGNVFVGDRHNHVVRATDAATGRVRTIAGRSAADDRRANDPGVRDPLALNLPQISSLDAAAGRLYVPTDLDGEHGDLIVLRAEG